MKRDQHIDALKGFSILLVVFGHSIQHSASDFDENLLFRVIYSFHMPLFMFLSGYLAGKKEINLRRKFMALVIPFVAWHLLNYVIIPANQSVAFSTYITRWIKSPDYGLWFLWVLFMNYCILFVVQRSVGIVGQKGELATLLTTAFFLQLLPVNEFGFDLIKWHFIFFGAGYYISRTKERYAAWKKPLSIISIICFPLLALAWHRTHGPSFEASMNTLFNSMGIPGAPLLLFAYRFAVPFLGIAFAFTLIPASGTTRMYSMLTFLGTITMDIYVVHQNLLFGFGAGMWKTTSAFAIALALSLLVSFIFRRSRLLSRFFLGRESRQQTYVSEMV